MPDPITTGLVSELTTQQKQAALPDKSNELGQEVFLELMVAQMQNQDPLSPQENSEFVAQLAQFSSVEGLDKLNNTMDNFVGSFQSGQALQASSMVGRVVKVDSETAYLPTDGAIAGTIELPQSTNNLSLKIYDSSGQLVADQMLGETAAGDIVFVWDGTDEGGNQAAADVYRFEAVANLDGKPVQVNTALSANVDSVTVGANGSISLNVAGVGPVSMSGVKEIL